MREGVSEREREREREKDRRETKREREREKKRDRQTVRQRQRETERQRKRGERERKRGGSREKVREGENGGEREFFFQIAQAGREQRDKMQLREAVQLMCVMVFAIVPFYFILFLENCTSQRTNLTCILPRNN